MTAHTPTETELILEERWVPITQSGVRWTPRSRPEAEKAMAEVPVGGRWTTGEEWDGIARIEHETRYVTEWTAARPPEDRAELTTAEQED